MFTYILIYMLAVVLLLFIIKKLNKNILRIEKDNDKLVYLLSNDEYLITKIDNNKDLYTQIKETLKNRKFELKNLVDYINVTFEKDNKINNELLKVLKS